MQLIVGRRAVLGLWLALSTTLTADTVIKKDGGKVNGIVLEEESDDAKLTIQTRFGKQRIARNVIQEIQYGGESVQDYKVAAEKYKDTAEDQFKLAIWCLENKYRKEYTKHLKRVIELDKDHPEARRRLGYQLHDGKWMTNDEFKESQGYIKHNGKWMLPQEKELADTQGEKSKSRQEIYKKIKLWKTWLKSEKSERYAEALAGLKSLKDPSAVKPLFEIFTDKKSVDSDRLVLVDVLAGIPGGESSICLVKVALNDNVEGNRQAAAGRLKDRKSPELLGEVLKYLKNNDNEKVNRAAVILAEIGDSSIYAALVNALVTKHKYTHEPDIRDMVQTQQGSSQRLGGTSVQPDGSITQPSVMTRLRAEGRIKDQQKNTVGWQQPQTQVVVEVLQNQEVLNALTRLTEQNFGFEKGRWLKWIKDDERARSSKIKT